MDSEGSWGEREETAAQGEKDLGLDVNLTWTPPPSMTGCARPGSPVASAVVARRHRPLRKEVKDIVERRGGASRRDGGSGGGRACGERKFLPSHEELAVDDDGPAG